MALLLTVEKSFQKKPRKTFSDQQQMAELICCICDAANTFLLGLVLPCPCGGAETFICSITEAGTKFLRACLACVCSAVTAASVLPHVT